MLEAMRWRHIGPFRAGRVTAVAGHPTNRLSFLFGACAGGVWRTDDGGIHWANISDGYFNTASVGALAMAASDPNVIYAGMGEACIRENVLHGDGVYRSTDGGKTWTHAGLQETRHISRIRIHPENPDIVYVAAFGHAFAPNPERGVYRTMDGGKTWQRVLFRDEHSGVIDLSMDPTNPRILYAATYQSQRTPWSLEAGGPGSGLFKTTDGGESWTELTGRPGLPEGTKGRLAVAVSPALPGRVYLSMEMAEDHGGIYRSDDGGMTWQHMTDNPELRQRPWYFSHIFADPVSANTLYVLNFEMWRSTDGGKNYEKISAPHVDHHDLWIDPSDPQRLINGHDGGAAVSYNAGQSWSSVMNQPTAQFYHVTTDNQFPYRVYGAQQDNSTLSVPSRTSRPAITNGEWYQVGGGECGYISVRPDDSNVVYAGSYNLLTRYDHRSGEIRVITPWPADVSGAGAKDAKYRFQWTSPSFLSPHDPHVLYQAANVVFRSRDEGASWDVVSPDLTRNDPSKLESSGGPVTKDNTSAEFYCTIFALAESPVTAGILWAGSDDGLIHLSRDGGKSWNNVTPTALPEWSLISIIEPSHVDPGTAYVAATGYKSDDLRPYLFRTRDYGAHWDLITEGIPDHEATRVVREDPKRPGLLVAGTIYGLHLSFDGGDHWQPFRQNLPVVPVHDLVFKDDDIVLATHGRGFWILDDVTPVREAAEVKPDQSAYVFSSTPQLQVRANWGFASREGARGVISTDNQVATWERATLEDGSEVMRFLDAGDNPAPGAVITYWLKEAAAQPITLTIRDSAGREIKSFSSQPPEPTAGEKPEPKLPSSAGSHRFVWDMRYPDAKAMPGAVYRGGGIRGPVAPPGTYQAELKVEDSLYTRHFELRLDPRVGASPADLKAQFDLLMEIRDQITAVHEAVMSVRQAREAVDFYTARAKGHPEEETVRAAGQRLVTALSAVEEELHQVKAKSPKDLLNVPGKLNVKLASLSGAVAAGQAKPTAQARAVHEELTARVNYWVDQLRQVMSDQGAQFSQVVADAKLPVVTVPGPR